jgi:hypothetical protein
MACAAWCAMASPTKAYIRSMVFSGNLTRRILLAEFVLRRFIGSDDVRPSALVCAPQRLSRSDIAQGAFRQLIESHPRCCAGSQPIAIVHRLNERPAGLEPSVTRSGAFIRSFDHAMPTKAAKLRCGADARLRCGSLARARRRASAWVMSPRAKGPKEGEEKENADRLCCRRSDGTR